ncbi:MAG: outer membrane lipoprotein chaperone LolA [Nitrospirota bacterium]
MYLKRLFYVLLIAMSIPADTAFADNELNAILKKIDEKQKSVETMKGQFVQRKSLSLLQNEVVSKGTMYFKRPQRMVWEYKEPEKNTMIVNGNIVWFYLPDLKEATKFDLSQKAEIKSIFEKMAIGMGQSGEEMKKSYDVLFLKKVKKSDKNIIVLQLIPKDAAISNFFKKIHLWFEEDGALYKTELFERNNDMTIIEFKNMKFNTAISDSVFDFKPPKGVKVANPLQ